MDTYKSGGSKEQLRRAEAKVDRALARLFAALEDAAPFGLQSKIALVMFVPGETHERVGTCAFAQDGKLMHTTPRSDVDQLLLGILRDAESKWCSSVFVQQFVTRYRSSLKGGKQTENS